MISVISVNQKFQTVTPKELIGMINESKYCRGIEISLDPNNDFMMSYMEELVNLCKENNILFQVHGDSSLDMLTQRMFMDKLSRYSDFLGYTINVVMHSLTRDTLEEAIKDTEEYFSELLKYINPEKIRISVENLNDCEEIDRLDKNEMIPVMFNDERLFMTYDIGHEIADYGKITDINPLLVERISNIHIHSRSNIYDEGFDHKPISDQKEEFEQVLKGILFLKSLDYDGPVVFEYDVYQCKGDIIKEQISDYLYSIDDTTEHMI